MQHKTMLIILTIFSVFTFIPAQSVLADQAPEILVIMDEAPGRSDKGLPTYRVCGLISNDVTCGIVDEEGLNKLLSSDKYKATQIVFEQNLAILSVDSNGEVIGANPYISSGEEK